MPDPADTDATDTAPPADAGIDPESYALDVLRRVGHGETLAALGDSLQLAVLKCQDTGKPAVVTLAFKIEPAGKGGAIGITDKLAAKLPDHQRPVALFFPDQNGRLHRDDPRQRQLPFGKGTASDDPAPVQRQRPADAVGGTS